MQSNGFRGILGVFDIFLLKTGKKGRVYVVLGKFECSFIG